MLLNGIFLAYPLKEEHVNRTCIRMIVCALVMVLHSIHAEFAPGDVFRQYRWQNSRYITGFLYLEGGDGRYGDSHTEGDIALPDNVDLESAVKVEINVEYVATHRYCTGVPQISLNGNAWISLPFVNVGVSSSEHTLWNSPVVEAPVGHLRQGGGNVFRFRVDGSGCYDQIYGVIFRVYYDPARKPHPTGRILTPAANAPAGESVSFTAETGHTGSAAVKRVEYLGNYEDISYRCDNQYRTWHYIYHKGHFAFTVGKNPAIITQTGSAPFRVTWNTQWVPQQSEPMKFRALITDVDGITFVSDDVTGVRLERPGLSVELCKPYNVPPGFGTGGRADNAMSANFRIAGAASDITSAKLVMPAWNAWNNNGLKINGVKLSATVSGEALSPSLATCNILPLSTLKTGENVLSTIARADQDAHGIEIIWPGFWVLVQYRDASVSVSHTLPSPDYSINQFVKADIVAVPNNSHHQITLHRLDGSLITAYRGHGKCDYRADYKGTAVISGLVDGVKISGSTVFR